MDRRHLAPGLAAFVAASLVALLGLRATARPEDHAPPTVDIQLLGTNDLHGYLQPRGEQGGVLHDAVERTRVKSGDLRSLFGTRDC